MFDQIKPIFQDGTDLVAPLMQMLKHSTYELYIFEAGLALTNLASYPATRDVLVAQDGWDAALDCLFSENERIQRVGLEMMCNLSQDPQVRFIRMCRMNMAA